MTTQNLKYIAKNCVDDLRSLCYEDMGIDNYSKQYIFNLLPNLEYYFEIYSQLIETLNLRIDDEYIVDFGGGHGFLSIFLSRIGYKVIYCDNNRSSVKTINLLKNILKSGPEFIIDGSTKELTETCKANNLTIRGLIASDVIEHIYNLDVFFADLYNLNPNIQMVFSTGSNPYNLYKSIRLYRIMIHEEKNNYKPQRKEYITENFPQLNTTEIDKLAKRTRGYFKGDILNAVNNYILAGEYPKQIEPFNTCELESGFWEERVLPFKRYKQSAVKNNFRIYFSKGYYNLFRNRKDKVLFFKSLNFAINYFGKLGWLISPILIIKLSPLNKQ